MFRQSAGWHCSSADTRVLSQDKPHQERVAAYQQAKAHEAFELIRHVQNGIVPDHRCKQLCPHTMTPSAASSAYRDNMRPRPVMQSFISALVETHWQGRKHRPGACAAAHGLHIWLAVCADGNVLRSGLHRTLAVSLSGPTLHQPWAGWTRG